MAIKASSSITLSAVVDVSAVYRYYLLQSSTLAPPNIPADNPPDGSWTLTEPGYTSDSTNSLYFTDLTIYSDGTYAYGTVSLSSSYEAAKAAYNAAVAAQSTASTAQSEAAAAQSAADQAQSTANSAEATAANVRAYFTFAFDGLRIRKSGSKWSTLAGAGGYYIDHDEVAGHVGAFCQGGLVVEGVQIGDMIARKTERGGWAWTEA